MKKVDIISGFLGAGKTTLIKKLLKERLNGENIVVIENEYGEVGIDGNILKSDNITIKEITSGCICCTISSSFKDVLDEVFDTYNPDRIIVEPSGVAKLSEVVKEIRSEQVKRNIIINMQIAVVDSVNFENYFDNFGEFFVDQITNAKTIILSKTQLMRNTDLNQVFKAIRKMNPTCPIITTNWDNIPASKILEVGEFRNKDVLSQVDLIRKPLNVSHLIRKGMKSDSIASDVFKTWGVETPKVFKKSELRNILEELGKGNYGNVIRVKGVVNTAASWIQFDYVPGQIEIKDINYDYTGRICVIGSELKKEAIKTLFLGE
ncbi:CobW family GTP-binding protein [Inconstantimicrobium mannanitabidum]|uniref:Cobalamin biosynthesis protein CobW n=1 Tax=Inconstantimicrobium mannanitabidum TaxID=1604901 RepID=A0ACB5RGZ5_9CLOT|nr:GTP-binding protein [Clostridium sp. TW13]GKX68371.1 cobalamin biosynthesis protein CobW [Clostridium sp. TW13]